MTIYEYLSRVSRPQLVSDISTFSSFKCVSERLKSDDKTELKPRFKFNWNRAVTALFRELISNRNAKYWNHRPLIDSILNWIIVSCALFLILGAQRLNRDRLHLWFFHMNSVAVSSKFMKSVFLRSAVDPDSIKFLCFYWPMFCT